MTYQEILAQARTCSGPHCKACPVCNGMACKNTMPGPGAKGIGTGAILMDTEAFAGYGPGTVRDLSAAIRAEMEAEDICPEPFGEPGETGWLDRW